MDSPNKVYRSPKVVELGTVAELTAAIGSSSRTDQSEFPQQFPPDHGSYDICVNDDPRERC